MDSRIQEILSELKSRFQILYGSRLRHLILYGSQARGDAEPDSDIDVLVILEGPVDSGKEIDRVSLIVSEISQERNVVIACVFEEDHWFNTRQGPFLRNVRREGIPL